MKKHKPNYLILLNSRCKEIPVEKYGDGYMPLEGCIYKGKISCVGRSGENLCGGIMGLFEKDNKIYVLCCNLEG